MSATQRLDMLISNLVHHDRPSTSSNGIHEETSIQSPSSLTFVEPDCYSTSILPSTILPTAVPLPPRRDASSLKHHRRRHPIDPIEKNKQPLLNSSTLDDLFRALTLECEQYLAATIAMKTKEQSSPQTIESNDDDYENLQTSKSSSSTMITTGSPSLKTSIEVISPIKRHVVSITVSSRVSTPTVVSPALTNGHIQPSENLLPVVVIEPPICRSSEEDRVKPSSSSTSRRRRRRTRKRMVSSTTTRSSSSSTERKEAIVEKKAMLSKRSYSTDHRHQRMNDNHSLSSSQQRGTSRRTHRRDVSLQHPFPHSSAFHQERSSPLSVLLTSSSKSTSDFLDNSHRRPQQQQQRRSRLETVIHKPLTLLDRMHQQFYRLSPTRTQKTNIPTTHRIPSNRVY